MRVQRGFGAIAAIVILVMLALLASAIISVGTSQHLTSAQDVMSAKAWQAARAGNEWGLFKALRGETWTATAGETCDTASRTAQMDLRADSGFNVSVYCDSWLYNEGEDPGPVNRTVRIYRIRSVACPAASCPASDASVAGVGYIERTRVVVAAN